MIKNHWIRQVLIRKLNKIITEKIKFCFGLEWNELLKKKITTIVFDFIEDYDLIDVSFAVELEKSPDDDISILIGIRIM